MKKNVLLLFSLQDDELKRAFFQRGSLVIPAVLIKESILSWAIATAQRVATHSVQSEMATRALLSTIIQMLEHNGKLVPEHCNVFNYEAAKARYEETVPVEDRNDEEWDKFFSKYIVGELIELMPDYTVIIKSLIDMCKKMLRNAPGTDAAMITLAGSQDSSATVNTDLYATYMSVIALLDPVDNNVIMDELAEETKRILNEPSAPEGIVTEVTLIKWPHMFTENYNMLLGTPKATVNVLKTYSLNVYNEPAN